MNQTLSSLSKAGLRLPDNFTQTIAASSATIVEKLNDVGITSLPTDMSVGINQDSITSIATSIGTATAGATVGAQQIAESIGELKSELLEDRGLVDQRITTSIEEFDGRVAQLEDETKDLDIRVVANTADISIISNETLPQITATARAEADKAKKTQTSVTNILGQTIPNFNKRIENIRTIAQSAKNLALGAKKV